MTHCPDCGAELQDDGEGGLFCPSPECPRVTIEEGVALFDDEEITEEDYEDGDPEDDSWKEEEEDADDTN